MYLDIVFRQGIGVDIQYVDSSIEEVTYVDEDKGTEEPAVLEFAGVQLLLPFIMIRIGEVIVHTKQ